MCVSLTGRDYLHTVSVHTNTLIYTLASTREDREDALGSLFITIYRLDFV